MQQVIIYFQKWDIKNNKNLKSTSFIITGIRDQFVRKIKIKKSRDQKINKDYYKLFILYCNVKIDFNQKFR